MSFIKRREDVPRISEVKRFMEYASFVPGFLNEYQHAPNKTLLKFGFHLVPDELVAERDACGNLVAKNPGGAMARYAEFMAAKLAWRETLRTDCTPADPVFKKWRERQINRCTVAFSAARSTALIHEVAAFELSHGCSVGCPFCGLNAGKLTSVFRYTEENAALWNDILDVCARVLGPGTGRATCYYGTEPLDNPDYERFIADYKKRFDRHPQLTTAAFGRDIARTKALIASLDPDDELVYRLSVRSREEFDMLMRTFTPAELLLVELLPQYDGAPSSSLIPVGRNRKDDVGYGDTIACISGFLINLCDKTVRLITPVKSSARFPNGQVCLMEGTFVDAASLEDTLRGMIGKMKNILSPREVLALYPWLHCEETASAFSVRNEYDFHMDVEKERSRPVFARTYALLAEGAHTRKEIVDLLKADFPEMDSAALFSTVNILWNTGLIWDSQLFGEPGTD